MFVKHTIAIRATYVIYASGSCNLPVYHYPRTANL